MAIYMLVPDKLGNVTAKGHEQWISVLTIHFNLRREIGAAPGQVCNRESTRPTLSEIAVSKILDPASPLLFSDACVGEAISEIKIHMCQSGTQLTPYMQYIFYNAIVSSYQITCEEHSTLSPNQPSSKERLTLSIDRIEMKYTPFDEKNKPQSPIPAGYDLRQATLI
jgi:type VI secretion system secreted protein Hcp